MKSPGGSCWLGADCPGRLERWRCEAETLASSKESVDDEILEEAMAERLARLAAHLAPRTVDGSAPAPAWATSRWSQAAGAAGPSPFDAVASEPLTWTRALAAPLPYREGPLSPAQWREFWEDGWTGA